MAFIFIDESGTLPDPHDNFIVLTAVVTEDEKILDGIINKEKKSIKVRRGVMPSELKFYTASDRSRKAVLTNLSSIDVKVFILAVNKERRKIADTPSNYGFLIVQLISDIFSIVAKENISEIVIDRHFNIKSQERRFLEFLEGKMSKDISVRQVDSLQNPGIGIADFVAGASLYKHSRNDLQYFDLIKERVIIEKIILWRVLKSSFNLH